MKKTITISAVFASMLFFSGCGTPATTSTTTSPKPVVIPMSKGTVLKSSDAGLNWAPKIKITDKTDISGINVLSMAINPKNTSNIYLGSESNGILESKDGAETWTLVSFPEKVYGLAIDPQNPDNVYASCVFNGRAKIFKRTGEGQEWKEIYTEPANGTMISSLAVNPANTQVIFAGTSQGALIKSTDAGKTWINLSKASGPVTNIVFDKGSGEHMYFLVFQKSILETKNGGATIAEIPQKVITGGGSANTMSLVADPASPGVFYVGTSAGLYRCANSNACSALNIIASSGNYPIRAVAINPANSKEIIYAAAKAIYKSTDSGVQWSTFQLDTSRDISALRYDVADPTKIYAAMRNF